MDSPSSINDSGVGIGGINNGRMRWCEPELPRDGGPPTIKNHSVTYYNGTLFCFGGYDGRRNHMTLMIYSLDEGRWHTVTDNRVASESNKSNNLLLGGNDETISGGGGGTATANSNTIKNNFEMGMAGGRSFPRYRVTGTPPPGRNGHTATLVKSDSGGGEARIIIIGGWLGSGPLAASDMHALDVSGGVDDLRWLCIPVGEGTPPGPCNMHSADFVSKKQEVYVFRGGNGREYLNDLHALNVNTHSWRLVETVGEAPQQRANHSSALLEETQELFIFGGWNGRERLNDVHILDTQTSTWSCPNVGGLLPHPRAGMTLTALRGRLYLFGGSGTSSKCFCDLQILDRDEMAWLDVAQEVEHNHNNRSACSSNNSNSNNNCSRTLSYSSNCNHNTSNANVATSIISSIRNNSTAAANPNDTETVPTIVVEGQGPGRRAGHTATAVGRHIYVFGGSCGSDYLNDFFVLDADPPPNAIVTEPTSLQLVGRNLQHFSNSPTFSDVTFIVEGKPVYGHRLILSTVSDCFRAMFATVFKESSDNKCADPINIPDCSYHAFESMMEYIYSGNLRQSMDISTPHGMNHIVQMLELADLFILEHLKQKCETLLQDFVNLETVDCLAQVAQKTNSPQLSAICSHFQRNIHNDANNKNIDTMYLKNYCIN